MNELLFGNISVLHFIVLSSFMFTIGVCGIILNQKNVITVLMSVELMLLAVNLNFVVFSVALGDIAGQIFSLFVLTVAAAEAAIGLAILVIFARNRGSIAVNDVSALKG
jgi:NADH-quinone oxidoreductase subunit K